MRFTAAALCLAIAACGQAAAPAETTTSPASPPPASAAPALSPQALAGVWSFDRSCASGDGMTLRADGAAAYDEWGEGRWAMEAPSRLVLTLAKSEPGVGPTGEHVTVTIDVAPPVSADLNGARSFDDGTPADTINARRCPETP